MTYQSLNAKTMQETLNNIHKQALTEKENKCCKLFSLFFFWTIV